MIYKVEGDIFLSKAQAIAHSVGLNDPMDKGLSLAMRNRFPALRKDFDRWRHQHNTRPGEAWMWQGPDNVRIINLITHEGMDNLEYHYGKATRSNIRQALTALVRIIAAENVGSIALPRLATGVGDLDWDIVYPLIENSLSGLTIPVYVYEIYKPGQAADEPGA